MEEWKRIENTIFSISNYGNIKNNKTNKILKQQNNNRGYCVVRVSTHKSNKCWIKKTFRIHRLVAQYFVDNPLNKPQVNHIDGNKNNNRYDNLEWVTNKENANHAIKHGLWDKVFKSANEANFKKRKPVIAINLETNEKTKYISVDEAEKEYGKHVIDVLKGRRSQTHGHFFFYE